MSNDPNEITQDSHFVGVTEEQQRTMIAEKLAKIGAQNEAHGIHGIVAFVVDKDHNVQLLMSTCNGSAPTLINALTNVLERYLIPAANKEAMLAILESLKDAREARPAAPAEAESPPQGTKTH